MKLAAVVFGLLLSVVAFAGSASNQGASRIWITDVTIISPENLDHIAEGNVLIEDGRIVSVERRKGTKKPAGATVVSGKGQFLIPGPHRLARPSRFYSRRAVRDELWSGCSQAEDDQ